MRRIFLSLAGFVTLFGLTAPPVQSASAMPTLQMKAQPETATFTGTILKTGENFVLNDAVTKTEYLLDNQDKLSPYEGKKVKITGRVDVANNLIHIETIQEIV
jgi:hypothetical protein